MSFEVDSCCFCVNLRVGCMAIGYLGVLGNMVLALIAILALAGVSVMTVRETNATMQIMGQAQIIILSIVLVFIIMNLAFNIILLIGLHKYIRQHVKAYLIYTSIYVIISIVGFASNFFTHTTLKAFYIARDTIVLVLSVYFLLVVKSYFSRMEAPPSTRVMYTLPKNA